MWLGVAGVEARSSFASIDSDVGKQRGGVIYLLTVLNLQLTRDPNAYILQLQISNVFVCAPYAFARSDCFRLAHFRLSRYLVSPRLVLGSPYVRAPHTCIVK